MSVYAAKSRIQWLGSVPADWKVVPAWSIFRDRSEKSLPEDVQLTPSQHYGVLTQLEYMELTGTRVVVNKSESVIGKRVRPGDFIIHLRSFQGGIEHSRVAGKVTNAYTVLDPYDNVDPEFYRHFLKSAPFIDGLSSMTDQLRDGQSINFSKFSTMRLPLPPLATQRAIADYLDRETAEIDAMAAELDELVERLEFRRSAAVTAAVPSPEESPAIQLPILAEVRPSNVDKKSKPDETPVRLCNYTDVYYNTEINSRMDLMAATAAAGQIERHRLEVGDVVITKDSESRDDIGIPALVTDVDGTMVCAYHLTLLRPNQEMVVPKYLYWSLLTVGVEDHWRTRANGVTRYSLTSSATDSLRIPLPPIDEQRRIVEHLDEVTAEIDSMIADAQELKVLLAERRSALITEVVTGRKEVPAA